MFGLDSFFESMYRKKSFIRLLSVIFIFFLDCDFHSFSFKFIGSSKYGAQRNVCLSAVLYVKEDQKSVFERRIYPKESVR